MIRQWATDAFLKSPYNRRHDNTADMTIVQYWCVNTQKHTRTHTLVNTYIHTYPYEYVCTHISSFSSTYLKTLHGASVLFIALNFKSEEIGDFQDLGLVDSVACCEFLHFSVNFQQPRFEWLLMLCWSWSWRWGSCCGNGSVEKWGWWWEEEWVVMRVGEEEERMILVRTGVDMSQVWVTEGMILDGDNWVKIQEIKGRDKSWMQLN